LDHQGSYPIFDAAYFRELAAKYEAADQHEIAAKLAEVATEFEETALLQEQKSPTREGGVSTSGTVPIEDRGETGSRGFTARSSP
jgi:hypothetical protein